ncbi:signal peptidase II [Jatrophihabitans endophyticus]|uniref:signal peptidase II n=1 Tax=Jatrophihabitans endophyticus TaxID=1206085 RepID=UPI000932758D|nr:signal peptidase II [Jatrophihabitans endophyticus]
MTSDVPAAATPVRRRRIVLFAAVAVLVLGLDVASKIVVVAQLPPTHRPVRILGGVLYLQQTRNSGAAFSLGTGFTVILTAVAVIVAVVIIRTAKRLRSVGWAIAFGLILGGAVGNLVDRFFRDPGIGRGHVVDWLSAFAPDAQRWPIFNLADSGIVVGAVLAGVLALAGVEFDGRRHVRAERDEA